MGQKLSCIDSARVKKRYKHFYIKINNLNLSAKNLFFSVCKNKSFEPKRMEEEQRKDSL
jgi:hypothetical protein